MPTPHDFVEALSVAGDAMHDLALAAAAAQRVALDDEELNQASTAVHFASEAGPRGLELARKRGDPQKLLDIQRATDNITSNLADFLIVDSVARFLSFPIVGLLALTPAQILEEEKEALANIPLPPPPQDLPWYVFAGGGAAAGAVLALTNTGNPKAIAGGAVGGALLGLGVQWGLGQLGKKFSIF